MKACVPFDSLACPNGKTYADLVGKLADIGVMDSEPNIRNKINRGKSPRYSSSNA